VKVSRSTLFVSKGGMRCTSAAQAVCDKVVDCFYRLRQPILQQH
jgi:hypothetical protein